MMDYNVVEDDSDVIIIAAAAAWINNCMDHSVARCKKVMPQDTTFFHQPKLGGSKAQGGVMHPLLGIGRW